MPRYMSFSETKQAIIDRTQTVTRRKGWNFLKPGNLLWAAEKMQGLERGTQVERLALIKVVSVTRVVLNDYTSLTKEDVIREGYPRIEPWAFAFLFCINMGGELDQELNRIEFTYVPESDWQAEIDRERKIVAHRKTIKIPPHLKALYLQRLAREKKERGPTKYRGKRGTREKLSDRAKLNILREALARQIGYWMDKVSPAIALEDAERVHNACKPASRLPCNRTYRR